MGPRDRLRARLVGSTCTACGAPVGTEAIRLLAQRDDLVFVAIACAACGSEILAIETVPGIDGDPIRWVDAGGYGEFGPRDEARFADAHPLVADDVLAVHRFLTGHRGGLTELLTAVSAPEDPDRRLRPPRPQGEGLRA